MQLPTLLPQGALVIHHELSFAHRMEAINDPWLRDNVTKQLMASYARLDVPAILEKAGAVGELKLGLVLLCIWWGGLVGAVS